MGANSVEGSNVCLLVLSFLSVLLSALSSVLALSLSSFFRPSFPIDIPALRFHLSPPLIAAPASAPPLHFSLYLGIQIWHKKINLTRQYLKITTDGSGILPMTRFRNSSNSGSNSTRSLMARPPLTSLHPRPTKANRRTMMKTE